MSTFVVYFLDGSVRLVGGSSSSEGCVEVYYQVPGGLSVMTCLISKMLLSSVINLVSQLFQLLSSLRAVDPYCLIILSAQETKVHYQIVPMLDGLSITVVIQKMLESSVQQQRLIQAWQVMRNFICILYMYNV